MLYEIEHPRNGTLYSAAYIFNREGDNISILEAENTIVGAMWNSDESILLTWEIEGEVGIWTLDGRRLHLLQNPQAGYGLTDATWSSDDRLFMVHVRDDTNLYVYTSNNAELYRLFPHENPVSSARWDSDGSHILSSSNAPFDCESDCSYQVYLWTTERELLATFPHDDYVFARWIHDDRHIMTSSQGVINVWNVSDLMQRD